MSDSFFNWFLVFFFCFQFDLIEFQILSSAKERWGLPKDLSYGVCKRVGAILERRWQLCLFPLDSKASLQQQKSLSKYESQNLRNRFALPKLSVRKDEFQKKRNRGGKNFYHKLLLQERTSCYFHSILHSKMAHSRKI